MNQQAQGYVQGVNHLKKPKNDGQRKYNVANKRFEEDQYEKQPVMIWTKK